VDNRRNKKENKKKKSPIWKFFKNENEKEEKNENIK
jgi:hypothetical protein